MKRTNISSALLLTLGAAVALTGSVAGCGDDSDPAVAQEDAETDGSTGANVDPGSDPEDDSGGPETDGDPEPEPEPETDGDPETGQPDPDDDTDTDDVPVDEDQTPPAVETASPADGDAGILRDAVIEVVFDEPMDKASVQAAWQSPELPSAVVTFAWNDEGTALTVTPNAPLVIADIASEEDPAERYSFSINTAAVDLAGNALDEPLEVEFTTARRLARSIEVDDAMTSTIRANGFVADSFDVLRVGDVNDIQDRAFLSFPLSEFPDDLVMLESAEVSVEVDAWMGAPMAIGGLGSLQLAATSYEAIESETFHAETEFIINILSLLNQSEGSADVRDFVLTDMDAGELFTQYRLGFGVADNGNGDSDYLDILSENAVLDVVVLIP